MKDQKYLKWKVLIIHESKVEGLFFGKKIV